MDQATPECLRLCDFSEAGSVWRFDGDDRSPSPNALVDVQASKHPLTPNHHFHPDGMNASIECKVASTI